MGAYLSEDQCSAFLENHTPLMSQVGHSEMGVPEITSHILKKYNHPCLACFTFCLTVRYTHLSSLILYLDCKLLGAMSIFYSVCTENRTMVSPSGLYNLGSNIIIIHPDFLDCLGRYLKLEQRKGMVSQLPLF